jgi:hypothetical protein
MRDISLSSKVRQVTGLAGTISVDSLTSAFLESIEALTRDGRDTSMLSDGQIQWIDRIFDEHFC